VGLGIADIVDGDYVSAKRIFSNILNQDPLDTSSMLNLSIAEYMDGNYSEAIGQIKVMSNMRPIPEEAYIFLPLVAIKKWKSIGEKGQQDVIESFAFFKKAPKSLLKRQEALLLMLYFDKFINNSESTSELLVQFLDQDPLGAEKYKKDLYLYSDATSWSSLQFLCKDLVESNASQSRLTTLEAVCLLNDGSLVGAKSKIELAITKAPDDVLAQSIFAYILGELGHNEQHEVALNASLENNLDGKYGLPFLLKANFCERQENWQCASRNWDQLIQVKRDSLPAIAGMIQILINDKEYSTANEYLSQGFNYSDKYIPFLGLRDKLSNLKAESKGQ